MRLMLKNKTVVTESGTVLGRVSDVEVMFPDGLVTKLDVRDGFVLGRKFLIDASQIVRAEEHQIVVQDAALAATDEAQTGAMPKRPAVEPMNRTK